MVADQDDEMAFTVAPIFRPKDGGPIQEGGGNIKVEPLFRRKKFEPKKPTTRLGTVGSDDR